MRYAFFIILTLLGAAPEIVLAGVGKSKQSGQALDDPRDSFYTALADEFRLPESSVAAVHDRKIPDDEVAVVCFLAKQAGIRPSDVVDLRLLKKSWMELTLHFGLSPEIFYVAVTSNPGPPYGKALAPFKKYRRTEWKKIILEDDDVINLVNLRVISTYYRISADEVIRLRTEGRSFVAIVKEITSPDYKARMAVTDKKVRPHLREPIKKTP